MKIIALVILFILLFFRIKGTPSMLSKTLYKKKMQKAIDKQNETTNGQELSDVYKGAAILIVLFMELFLITFYAVLGTRLGTTPIIILSVLQIITCIYNLVKNLNNKAFSRNVEDFKFYRLYFLFNVVLDYIYYPLTIYMLLK